MMTWILLWSKDALSRAAHAFACVLAEGAHAFAKLFACSYGAALGHVLPEAFAAATGPATCASESSLDAATSTPALRAYAPASLLSVVRYTQHASHVLPI